MNRQIKFRVWNLRFQEWEIKDKIVLDCDGYVIFNDGRESSFIMDDSSLVVQQFTGLKDKNDREIYEGDIVKLKAYDGWKDSFGRYIFAEVLYHEETARFRTSWNKETYRGDCFDNTDESKDVAVVGNICESPDLLKSPAIDLKVHSVYVDSDGSIYCYDKDGKDVEYPVAWPEKIENLVKFMDRQGIKIVR